MATLCSAFTDACQALDGHVPPAELMAHLSVVDDATTAGERASVHAPAKGSLAPTDIGYKLSKQDITALCNALVGSQGKGIVSLCLRNLSISNENCAVLAEFLRKSSETLEALDLSGTDFDGDGLKVLAEALGEHAALRRLTLRNCKIGGTPGFPCLVVALQKNKSIQELDVGNTNLDVDNLIQLRILLSENETLRGLNLDRPLLPVGQEEIASHVADMLRQNNTLTSVSLKKFRLGDHGANEIAVALRDNTALETLDVSSNDIGRTGAASFGEALKINRSLRRLNLNHNVIQDEGLLALVNSLLQNEVHTLHTLCVAHNDVLGTLGHKTGHVYYSGLAYFAQALPTITSLQSFHVWGNPAIAAVGQLDIDALKFLAALVEDGTYDVDIKPYTVDGQAYLAEKATNSPWG